MTEPVSVEVTGVKKTVVLIFAGGLVVLCVAGMFVPDARIYAVETAKFLLSAIQTVVK